MIRRSSRSVSWARVGAYFGRMPARRRYDAGMGYEEAGRDIELGPYADRIDRFAAPSAAACYYFDERAGRLQSREARANGEDGR